MLILWTAEIDAFSSPRPRLRTGYLDLMRIKPTWHGRFYHSESPSTTTKLALRLPSAPLISADDAWGNWSFLAGMATLAQFLGKSTGVGRLLGPPVTAMALTFCFASVGVLNPGGTEAAKSLQLICLQLATPLLLLGADLRDCASRCGPLLEAFLVASVATIVACTVGWVTCGTLLTKALGRDGLVVAAALMAKNVGGGINYVAVCRCLSASPEAFAAGFCVDNLFGLVYFPISSALSAGRPDLDDASTSDGTAELPDPENTPITLKHITSAVWVGSLLIWLGEKFGGNAGALPLCTLLTVALTSLAPKKWMLPLQPASHLLGGGALYLFFAAVGAPGLAVADSVKTALFPLGLFLTILYSIHGLIMGLCCKIMGGKGAYMPQRLLVASSAAIGGPATAAALAQAMGWRSLLAPSLLVGNLGYAIATFAGLAYHGFFSR
ncbi:Protein of unknown function (DUF819) [Fragilaria crotonensis]|nr:Protein of unknown function (DUF819) [Fragilaria crotonensis]